MDFDELKKKLAEISDYIDSAKWDLEEANDVIFNVRNNFCSYGNSIKDIKNFKNRLKTDGLYSQEIEDFINNYMVYYNN